MVVRKRKGCMLIGHSDVGTRYKRTILFSCALKSMWDERFIAISYPCHPLEVTNDFLSRFSTDFSEQFVVPKCFMNCNYILFNYIPACQFINLKQLIITLIKSYVIDHM